MSGKTLSSGIARRLLRTHSIAHQQTCAFTISALRRSDVPSGDSLVDEEVKKTPYRTERFLSEQAENAPRRFNIRPRRPDGDRRSSNNRSSRPAERFELPPTIPYDTTKELEFADQAEWEVSSVLEPRPAFANIAAGRGTTAPLGINNTNNANDVMGTALPGTAFSAHISGVRSHGDLDPEVEQSLIQELSTIQQDKEKDHRKVADLSPAAQVEHQKFLFHRLTNNFQEILNPRNPINRFNNGNVKHMANNQYVTGSDEVVALGDQQLEKSWKRLERLGGDYSRSIDPLSLLGDAGKVGGPSGKAVLENVSQLIGQNQSIGLEDKKKMLKAVEKGLGGY
ncbi:hypothetical protein BG011_006136 [Mortierella polycephala]|uniref:Uncharacterized protein n=1 Tax=Mortierella polycephala TaxID=41804 RepID=A0A9P6PWW0_9FUNG|nr:hypothetical protein BG011_006136 [Mortierella polycephala]